MSLAPTAAVLEYRFTSNEQRGFPALESGTAHIVRSHLLLTKETLLYATSAGKLGLILDGIVLNGRELYERTMTLRAWSLEGPTPISSL